LSSDDFDFGAGNKEAAECLKELKRYIRFVNKFRDEMYEEAGLPIPESYNEAYDKVLQILYEEIEILSDPNTTTKRPHVEAPMINPHMAPILRFEREQLKQIRIKIRRDLGFDPANDEEEGEERSSPPKPWYKRVWNKLSKGFNSADIIIDSLQNSLPGLSFVGEFKKQLQNLLP